MQDGKGALYFIKPQATPKARQQMREDSPSGPVDMDPWLGRSFGALTITTVLLIGLTFSYIIDFAMM